MSEPPPPPMADVAKLKHEHFRFFDLPAELRDDILEMALLYVTGTDGIGRTLLYTMGPMAVWVDYGWWLPALLVTSQQLRKEAGSVYFKKCNFIFMNKDKAAKWVSALDEDFRSRISTLSYNMCSAWPSKDHPKSLVGYFAREAPDVVVALKSCVRPDEHYWHWTHDWKPVAEAAKEEEKRERQRSQVE